MAELRTQDNIVTNDNTWTTVSTYTLDPGEYLAMQASCLAVRQDDVALYGGQLQLLAWNDGGSITVDDNLTELGQKNLNMRADVNGNDIDIQVRGRNNQDWRWLITEIFFEFNV